MVTGLYTETLEQLHHTTRLNRDSRSYAVIVGDVTPSLFFSYYDMEMVNLNFQREERMALYLHEIEENDKFEFDREFYRQCFSDVSSCCMGSLNLMGALPRYVLAKELAILTDDEADH
jgi:hypothetical protein